MPTTAVSCRRLVEATRDALDRASDDAEQTDDHLAYYNALIDNTRREASLYVALAHFEQRLSKVETDVAPDGGS